MRGLELRKGTVDIALNDVAPDIVYQLEKDPHLQIVESPGVDYQYVGVNLRDPILMDVRVRQALAYAIDRHAIVDYLRRGLAGVSTGILPPLSWAYAPDSFVFPHDPAKARALLDEAGYPDPDGDGPKATPDAHAQDHEYRVQPAAVGVGAAESARHRGRSGRSDVRVRDAIRGCAGRELSALFPAVDVADRSPIPTFCGACFIRTRSRRPVSTAGTTAIPKSTVCSTRRARRRTTGRRLELFQQVQRIVARDLPYISLWYKTNFAVAQRTLTGVRSDTACRPRLPEKCGPRSGECG